MAYQSRFLRKIIFPFGLLILVLVGWLVGQARFRQANLLSLPDHSIIDFQLGERSLKVELVNTPESITQGLGGRESLTTDGMLFVFDQPREATFWMKEMRFPIDIIWLSNGQVVGIERNVLPPEPGTPDEQLRRFQASQPFDMVLETNPNFLEDQL